MSQLAPCVWLANQYSRTALDVECFRSAATARTSANARKTSCASPWNGPGETALLQKGRSLACANSVALAESTCSGGMSTSLAAMRSTAAHSLLRARLMVTRSGAKCRRISGEAESSWVKGLLVGAEEEGPARNAAPRSAKRTPAMAESSEARWRFGAWCTVDGVGALLGGEVSWSPAVEPHAKESSAPALKAEAAERVPESCNAESRAQSYKAAQRLKAVSVRPANCSTLAQAESKAPSIEGSKKVFLAKALTRSKE